MMETADTQTTLRMILETERKAKGLSFRSFAPTVGLPWSTYEKWANGKRNLGMYSLWRVAKKRPELFVDPMMAIREKAS